MKHMLTMMIAIVAGVGRASHRGILELCAVHTAHMLDLLDLQIKSIVSICLFQVVVMLEGRGGEGAYFVVVL
jgi:hypothetical protein